MIHAEKPTAPVLPFLEQQPVAIKPSVRHSRRQDEMKPTTSSSPSVSSVAGSGMGPSITHLFDSYFVRIKFSIFLQEISPRTEFDGQQTLHTLQKEHAPVQALLPNICESVSIDTR